MAYDPTSTYPASTETPTPTLQGNRTGQVNPSPYLVHPSWAAATAANNLVNINNSINGIIRPSSLSSVLNLGRSISPFAPQLPPPVHTNNRSNIPSLPSVSNELNCSTSPFVSNSPRPPPPPIRSTVQTPHQLTPPPLLPLNSDLQPTNESGIGRLPALWMLYQNEYDRPSTHQ